MTLSIREEEPGDAAAIRAVHDRAFEGPVEGRLVDALRAEGGTLLSLVALREQRIVGHILYSPASIEHGAAGVRGAALGPMAVSPECQRAGVGGALVRAGNDRLRAAGVPFIVVLGHADYYPRFGFVPASRHGLRCEWDVPDDVFMVLVLQSGRLAGVSGLVRYHPEFSNAV